MMTPIASTRTQPRPPGRNGRRRRRRLRRDLRDRRLLQLVDETGEEIVGELRRRTVDEPVADLRELAADLAP